MDKAPRGNLETKADDPGSIYEVLETSSRQSIEAAKDSLETLTVSTTKKLCPLRATNDAAATSKRGSTLVSIYL
jgi:hypothetical protein